MYFHILAPQINGALPVSATAHSNMAKVQTIKFHPHRARVVEGSVCWIPTSPAHQMTVPQIYWDNMAPWREANLWLMLRSTSFEVDPKTVIAQAHGLHYYACWLEATETDWWDFPLRKDQRCLVRFRGELIKRRNLGKLAPSTTAERMRVVISFYRWIVTNGLMSTSWPIWQERTIGVRLKDTVGLDKTIQVQTTDLSIRNRKLSGLTLEGGLTPITSKDRDKALEIARSESSEELFLMLSLGFFTGMRLQTICDLKIQTILLASRESESNDLYKISIGPGAAPPVATKFGVTGHIYLSSSLHSALTEYIFSERRHIREEKAEHADKDLIFLTKHGNSYSDRSKGKSPAINVAMHSLRRIGKERGIQFLSVLKFHQTRCTFATELARIALKNSNPRQALLIVKEALLHKDEATSLKYIRFIEEEPIKEQLANQFTREFLSINEGSDSE